MATSITPQIIGPEGVARTSLTFSTTIGSRFFTGTCDASTVDLEVSVNGTAYTQDPDLVSFDGTTWMVPNPASYPDGLALTAGTNTILVRAVTASGSVSSPASVTVRLVRGDDASLVAETPTKVSVEQLDGSVRVTVDAPSDTSNLRGINFYASLYEGGGATGYIRVNIEPVGSGTTVEETSTVGTFEVEADVARAQDGSPAADPLYAKYVGTQVDADGATFQSDFSETLEVPETAVRLRTTVTLESVATVTQYSFLHSRAATPSSDPPTVNVGAFAAAPTSDPLYYVVTAVYFDPTSLLEVESAFSAEVVGHPLVVSTAVGTFPVVTRQQIIRNTTEAIYRSNPQVKVEPGSVLRDTFIDPFASEATRLRFIIDFLHRAQSFPGLLGVDDPAGTGSSVPVSTSTYKQALKQAFGLTTDTDAQAVIDRAFESLASNYGIYRRSGRFARGEVTFYTTRRPTRTIQIPLGTTVSGGSAEFKTTASASFPYERLAQLYDPTTSRYKVTVSVQAAAVGSAGNIAAGQVRKVVSGVTGLSVVNSGSMFGGTDQETNRELATRAMNALASVDSGTARGYLQTAADVPGVVQANVVSAGDDLMVRDLDANGVHRGGKVDVWVQGQNLATVTDTFAFARSEARNIHFVVIGDPANLLFQAIDPALSQGTPIVEMLDDATLGLGLRNVTTGESFDLTGVVISSFNLVQLSTDVVQPTVTLTDVVLGDYRRITGNTFVLPRQPVRSISTITGAASGELPTTTYRLVHPKDPLGEGLSELAGDYVEITPVDDGSGGLIPSGGTVSVSDESHVLVGVYPEYLDNIGADPLSVVVKSADGLTTYRGPNDPSGFSDYTLVDGDETTPISVVRTTTGDIASGATVLISYDHDENFVVTYTTNVIVGVVQDAVDARKHVTADVLAKEAVEVPVDITATVILVRGAEQSSVDSSIRTSLANKFARLRLGDPIRQSDIVAIIEGTTGVSYVEVPLTTLVRQEGSTVVRESLRTDQAGDVTYIAAWSNATVSTWLIEGELAAATTDGGGPEGAYRAVFQDDVPLTLVTSSPSTSLPATTGRSFIIGAEGISIPGLSDDVTLAAAGYTTTSAMEAQRIVLTANRVLLSTGVDDSPANHVYGITYVVGTDAGAKNIDTSAAEYLSLGNVEFTFDEDR